MTFHRTATVDGLTVFYREAGDPASPRLLLLGGYPASSHQFRNLIPLLADRFHVVAPDYPGFGYTDMPDPATFAYTFDHLAEVVEGLLVEIGFDGPMGIFMQDYGGPIGNRIIGRHPEWLEWQILQNSNAYEEGFTAAWGGFRDALWVNPGPETEAPLEAFLTADVIRMIYTQGHRDPAAISPDKWTLDVHFLERPHARRAQLDLFYDYRTNVELYPAWQALLRDRRPPTLILWAQNDIFFTPEGGEAYLRDLPDAELIRLDTGHFAAEDSVDEMATAIRRFHRERVAGALVAR